jgi:hypothetical protein
VGEWLLSTGRSARPPVSTTGHRQSRDRREGECDATHQLHEASFPMRSVNSITAIVAGSANPALTSG